MPRAFCNRHVLLVLPLLAVSAASAATPTEIGHVEGANIQRPVWSPDGSTIAFEANFHDLKKIELRHGPPGGEMRLVQPRRRQSSGATAGFTSRASGQVVHEVSFAPPAIGRFVFSASGSAADYDLHISGGGPVAAGPGADGGPAWSPSGRMIAFTSARTGQGDLYLLDIGKITAPPIQLTSDPTSAELYPAWSPDSSRLAYVGHSPVGDNLWLIDAARGADARQLTRWKGTQTHPQFSPDGTKLAFYADREGNERFDLYVMDLAGGEPTRLATDIVPNATGPSWTPSGDRILFVANDDDRFDPICSIEVRSGATPQVHDLGTVGHGDLSVARDGDGLMVAYVAQGLIDDRERTFKRLFMSRIDF